MKKDFLKPFPNKEKRQKDFKCSLGFAMTVIGSKWRAIVLWHIVSTPSIRYGVLKKSIPEISHKVLSQELKKLEDDNLVIRTEYPEIPPRVEYSPTERGLSLENILSELCEWGKNIWISNCMALQ